MRRDLQRAITHHHVLQIIYLGSQGQTTSRNIRPIAIVGNHVKAYCLMRRAPRVFAIDQILALSITKDHRAM